MYLENIGTYPFFRQLWLVLGVKLMEINSNWFSRYSLLVSFFQVAFSDTSLSRVGFLGSFLQLGTPNLTHVPHVEKEPWMFWGGRICRRYLQEITNLKGRCAMICNKVKDLPEGFFGKIARGNFFWWRLVADWSVVICSSCSCWPCFFWEFFGGKTRPSHFLRVCVRRHHQDRITSFRK